MTEYRTGLGWDNHRLAAGRVLILAGIVIPHETGFEAHSDGDILLHAVTDALLGAVALGDIGMHFPDTDPQWQGVSSDRFVQHALRLVRERGFELSNVDTTVILQRPKLKDYREQIRLNLASLVGLPSDRVNVKFKTAEKVGPVGQELSAEAQAIVTILRHTDR